MLLSLVVPCYNEEDIIEKFYKITSQYVRENKYINDYEFVFINDGSKDRTLERLKKINSFDKKARYVSFSRNFGKEAAIYSGLQHSKGDLIVLMDADLQHPPYLLEEMSRKIVEESYDSVGAVRADRKGENKIRAYLSKKFYTFINSISDVKMEANSTDYRMMTRQFVDSVLSLSEYNRFTKGIFSWVGYNNATIKYENVERELGESKWNFFKLLKYSMEGIISFSTVPLMISSLLGFLLCFFSILIFLIFIIKYFVFGEIVKGFLTLICSIFLLGGVQLLSIGVLGQYLSKAYLEVKNRPVYIVKESSDINEKNKKYI